MPPHIREMIRSLTVLLLSGTAVLAEPNPMPDFPPFSTFSQWTENQREAYESVAFLFTAAVTCQEVPGFTDINPTDLGRSILVAAPFSPTESEAVASFVQRSIDPDLRISNPNELPAKIACSIMLERLM